MATTIFAIPTLAGQAALAAAMDPVTPVPITISEMVVGDGNGNPVTPLETMTGLVNPLWTGPVVSAVRVGSQTTFDALLDENVGPFTIREAGLLSDTGQLLFVASTPSHEKLTPAENVSEELTLGLVVVVSETAQVVLLPPPGSLIAAAQLLRAPFITVDTAATLPPPAPAEGATILVQPGAGGAFIGQTHSLAQWNGLAWTFKTVPVTHLIGRADTGQYFRRTVAGWAEIFLPPLKLTKARLLYAGCF